MLTNDGWDDYRKLWNAYEWATVELADVLNAYEHGRATEAEVRVAQQEADSYLQQWEQAMDQIERSTNGMLAPGGESG